MTGKHKSPKPIHICLRCGHVWKQRGDRKPVVCPNKHCHSLRWDFRREY